MSLTNLGLSLVYLLADLDIDKQPAAIGQKQFNPTKSLKFENKQFLKNFGKIKDINENMKNLKKYINNGILTLKFIKKSKQYFESIKINEIQQFEEIKSIYEFIGVALQTIEIQKRQKK